MGTEAQQHGGPLLGAVYSLRVTLNQGNRNGNSIARQCLNTIKYKTVPVVAVVVVVVVENISHFPLPNYTTAARFIRQTPPHSTNTAARQDIQSLVHSNTRNGTR